MNKNILLLSILSIFQYSAIAQTEVWKDYKEVTYIKNTDAVKISETKVRKLNKSLKQEILIDEESEWLNEGVWINKTKQIKSNQNKEKSNFKWSNQNRDWAMVRKERKYEAVKNIQTWKLNQTLKADYLKKKSKIDDWRVIQLANKSQPSIWKDKSRVRVSKVDEIVVNIEQILDEGTGAWRNYKRKLTNKSLGEVIHQKWESKERKWQNIKRTITDKSTKGQKKDFIYKWEEKINSWSEKTLKIHYHFGKKLDKIEYFRWLADEKDWQLRSRRIYERENGKLARIIYQKLLLIEDDEQSIIALEEEDESNIEEIVEISCDCNFPNPYALSEEIRCEKVSLNENSLVQLFDMQGRLVTKMPFQANNFSFRLDENILAGMYILVITEGAEVIFKEKVIAENR